MTKKSFTPYDYLNDKQRRVFHDAYRGIKQATSDKEALEYEKIADMLFAISIRNYRNKLKAEKEQRIQMAKHSLEVEGFQVEDRHVELVRRVLCDELSQEEFDRLALEAARKKGENE